MINQYNTNNDELIKAMQRKIEVLEKSSKRHRFFDKVLDQITENIFWMDISGNIVDCNEKQAINFRIDSKEKIIGKNIVEIGEMLGWNEEISRLITQNNKKVISLNKTLLIEETLTIENEERYFLSSKSPLHSSSGDIIGIVGIATDITERKKLEKELMIAKNKAEESNQAKSEFIQNMCHDIRTPLTGLVSIAEGQVSYLADSHPFFDLFVMMRDASQQLHRMLESFIESASADYRENVDNPMTFNIKSMLEHIISMFKPTLLTKQLTYHLEPLSESSLVYKGHPMLIERILINLIGNAAKFTGEGGTLNIRYGFITNDSDASVQLKLEVQDTGIGIEPDKQSIIFDALTRLTHSFEGIYEGQGLGLYITKKLVELMDGTISVTSEGKNKGSTFTCIIPIEWASNDRHTSDNTPSRYNESDNRHQPTTTADNTVNASNRPQAITDHHTILIVDDVQMVRRILTLFIKRQEANCHVDEAATDEQVITAIKNKRYDLILMDIGLSRLNGLDLTRIIHNDAASQNRQTTVLAVTGHVDENIRQACFAAGMSGVFYKPLKPTIIAEIFDDYLAKLS